MLTRRSFIESATVITGAALSGVALADGVSAVPARIDHLIYNTRFAHAQQFAQHLIAQGVQGVGVGDNDVGTVWFGELRASCVEAAQCLRKPSIVGLGTHTDFFVMQSLARDIGLATRFHAEHRRVQGAWQHQLKQNDWMASEFNLVTKDHWALALADALSNRALSQSQLIDEQSHLMNSHEPRLLVSWVLG